MENQCDDISSWLAGSWLAHRVFMYNLVFYLWQSYMYIRQSKRLICLIIWQNERFCLEFYYLSHTARRKQSEKRGDNSYTVTVWGWKFCSVAIMNINRWNSLLFVQNWLAMGLLDMNCLIFRLSVICKCWNWDNFAIRLLLLSISCISGEDVDTVWGTGMKIII